MVHNAGSRSVNAVTLRNGAFKDIWDAVNAYSLLEWDCTGPNSSANYEIVKGCGFLTSGTNSYSLDRVRLQNGTNYDLYDSNGATSILRWSCI